MVGVAVVLWGVGGLLAFFVRERDDARASLAARRAALREYALRALDDELRGTLGDAAARVDAARRDPLVDAAGLLLVEDGKVVLPRSGAHAPGDVRPSLALRDAVRAGTAKGGDDVLAERLALAARFRRALAAKDDPAVERSFRELLVHRARFRIAATEDVPIQLAVLEELAARSRPDRALMRALLRDGIGEESERIEGLQRLLLARREKFTKADFEALAASIAALATASGVETSDFEARVRETPPPAPAVPDEVGGLVLVDRAWIVGPHGPAIAGVAVDVDARLAAVATQMRARGLAGAGEGLVLARATPGPRVESIAMLPIEFSSPAFAAEEARITRRFAGKAAMGVLLGAGAAAIVGLGLALVASEGRFLRLKSDFVATVSHELRTPIASLRLLAETLEKRLAGMPEARDYPRRILADVDSLTFMVENILSFHRLERDGWTPRVGEVRVGELAEWLRREYGRANVVVSGGDSVLDADPDLLKLLFSNLASNACKYNKRDPVEIAIEASGRVIRFRDNGVGIAPEEREMVFAEFFRGRSSGEARGFGLGLAICARIMRLHGGEIRVADSGPDGTSFELVFPEAA